jgi:dephospho-CoA kinase
MIIIGITGTLGAGKGTIVEFLVRERGFTHLSVRSFITAEIVKRGLPVNRDNMVLVANGLRTSHSPSYIVDCLYDQALLNEANCIIESIRTPGEIISLREKGNFILFAVDAEARTRFERIRKRQSETDFIDFETFTQNESREMTSDNPNHQNLRKCIEMADFVFNNDGTVTALELQIDQTLQQFNIR